MGITIKEIAEMAGVSRGTVDRALNQRGRINQEVADRILRIAEEHGYKSNRNKKKQGKILKIGVVTQLDASSFMIQVHKGIKDAGKELKERGVEVLVRGCDLVDIDKQLKAIDDLMDIGIDGLAIMPIDADEIRLKINKLADSGIPIITFNTDIVGTKRICFVGLDNKKSGHTASGLMGMMSQGRGKILIITGYFSNSASGLRVDGFIEEMKRSYPKMELLGVQSSFDDEKEVERIIENTLSTVPDITGIFVASGGQNGVKKAFDKMNQKQRPYVIIYDKTPENIQALKRGEVDFLIDQEGYKQGYLPPVMLSEVLIKENRSINEYEYTNINILTKYNI
jgi:LacI family transcriptional regulator